MIHPAQRIFCALDTTSTDKALQWARDLSGTVGGLKLGLEYFNAQGPQGVHTIIDTGMPVFLDLKYHDIPNTVAGAVKAAVPLGAAFINIHASGGRAMMKAAADAASESSQASGVKRPEVLGVTILTSLDASDLTDLGITRDLTAQVVALARLAQDSGLDGVVCSSLEITAIREACGPDFTLMVPGIRPVGADTGDQKRMMSPTDAIAQGADYLVIGRPITQAENPGAAAKAISASLEAA